MARSGRVKSEIGIYHVLLRGVDTLFQDNADFDEFKRLLKKYAQEGSIRIFSYTLLDNRVHMVVGTDDDIGRALKPLCISYARYVNRTYSREGRIFYDRLKSEPLNFEAEVKSAVAFVNEASTRGGENYPHCSRFSGADICTRELLTEAERTSCDITEMFMEDYDCLSPEELDGYIIALCGTSSADFNRLSPEEQQTAIEKLTRKKWIARTKLYAILGIGKPRAAVQTEKKAEHVREKKTEEPPARKQELSVWLL